MNIAFFSENGFTGKVSRDHLNMRVEFAWMCALGADHYNIHDNVSKYMDNYDLGIIIIPKKNPQFDLDSIKKCCKKVATMQEGPHWYFQDYPISQQIWFYNVLKDMDFLFVHNEIDKKYYEGLTGKECKVMPSLMIEDSISNLQSTNRSNVIIGGNFCQWYGGFDSYMVAQEFEEMIYVPSMGRRIPREEEMENLNHLPYMNWVEWINRLNQFKYGVHLMRTHAAGTFALNCAYLGIPCIGYEGLDTQMICHSDCTVEVGDITKARKIAIRLASDKDFYTECSINAKKKFNELYAESVYKERINKMIRK
tara:strand:- start:2607 stop:3533 length:927 start_codon:yes stop_codon:yes gene_type:complete